MCHKKAYKKGLAVQTKNTVPEFSITQIAVQQGYIPAKYQAEAAKKYDKEV